MIIQVSNITIGNRTGSNKSVKKRKDYWKSLNGTLLEIGQVGRWCDNRFKEEENNKCKKHRGQKSNAKNRWEDQNFLFGSYVLGLGLGWWWPLS